uniref:Uncharacterized protein TCIL3000_11_7320 n=1 Tax=Trypanosoma congolense (strain IL3000) TaxID=1068625 RepID=G0V0X8_TRYCI|nr:unnamed protein product [Trypanosoma congolense IL3000]
MKINLSQRNINEFDSSAFSTKEEMEILDSITEMDLSRNKITSLSGLLSLSALAVLDVSHNNIASLDPLPVTLRRLTASFNMICDVGGLSLLVQLQELNLANNRVTSLAGLPPSLCILEVSNNLLPSLAALERCPNLRTVQAQNNAIQAAEGLVPLANLRSLQVIALGGNPVVGDASEISAVRALLPPSLKIADFPTAVDTSVLTPPKGSPAASPVFLTGEALTYHSVVSSCAIPTTVPPAEKTVVPGAVEAERGSAPNRETVEGCREEITEKMNEHKNLEDSGALQHNTSYESINVSQDACEVYCSPEGSSLEAPVSTATPSEQDPILYVLNHVRSELHCCQALCETYKKETEELRKRTHELERTCELQALENAKLRDHLHRMQRELRRGATTIQEKERLAQTLEVGSDLSESHMGSSVSSREEASSVSTEEKNVPQSASRTQGGENRAGPDRMEILRRKTEMRDNAHSLAAVLMSIMSTTKTATGPLMSPPSVVTPTTGADTDVPKSRNRSAQRPHRYSASFATPGGAYKRKQ